MNILISKLCEKNSCFYKLIVCIGFLLTNLAPFLLQSCASVSIRPSSAPFDYQNIAHIIPSFKEQETRVHSFFSSGQLISKRGISESESNILIVGTKAPFIIKIETTHQWGYPLFHFLVYETKLQILSFPDKKYYSGSFRPTIYFPVRLESSQIWSLLRGYPVLQSYNRAHSFKGNQITFFDNEDDIVQIIDFFPNSKLPRRISFPQKRISIVFSNFKNENNIYYASNINLHDQKTGIELALELKQIAFNKTIPKKIFDLKIPPDFKLLSLKEIKKG